MSKDDGEKEMSLIVRKSDIKREKLMLLCNDSRVTEDIIMLKYDDANGGERLSIPFAMAQKYVDVVWPRPNPTQSYEVGVELRPEQRTMVVAALKCLRKRHVVTIGAHCGFGKTIIALYIASFFKMRTIVLIHRNILAAQWQEAIGHFFPGATSQYARSGDQLDPLVDFTVMNIINTSKFELDSFKFVIVDEIHQMVTKKYSFLLLNFTPLYLIGLSATPYRFDEFNDVIPWFFGTKRLSNALYTKHIVDIYRYDDSIQATYIDGTLNWNEVLKSQSEDPARNDLIVDIVMRNLKDRQWLILVKRVKHSEILVKKFGELGQAVETLHGTKQTYNKVNKILIGTTNKIGVGFDDTNINALFIAGDIKNYFVQFMGRCMRNQHEEDDGGGGGEKPYIADIADGFPPLNEHSQHRCYSYRQYGGTVTYRSSDYMFN